MAEKELIRFNSIACFFCRFVVMIFYLQIYLLKKIFLPLYPKLNLFNTNTTCAKCLSTVSVFNGIRSMELQTCKRKSLGSLII